MYYKLPPEDAFLNHLLTTHHLFQWMTWYPHSFSFSSSSSVTQTFKDTLQRREYNKHEKLAELGIYYLSFTISRHACQFNSHSREWDCFFWYDWIRTCFDCLTNSIDLPIGGSLRHWRFGGDSAVLLEILDHCSYALQSLASWFDPLLLFAYSFLSKDIKVRCQLYSPHPPPHWNESRSSTTVSESMHCILIVGLPIVGLWMQEKWKDTDSKWYSQYCLLCWARHCDLYKQKSSKHASKTQLWGVLWGIGHSGWSGSILWSCRWDRLQIDFNPKDCVSSTIWYSFHTSFHL